MNILIQQIIILFIICRRKFSILVYKITNVDPMLEYNKPEKHLLFERYLNPERVSLPDIDMDMNGLLNKDLLLNKINVGRN